MAERRSVLLRLDPDVVEAIDAQLSYGESRNAWVVAAIRRRLKAETVPARPTPSMPETPRRTPTAGPRPAPVASFDPDQEQP